jgi:hypothetical protein
MSWVSTPSLVFAQDASARGLKELQVPTFLDAGLRNTVLGIEAALLLTEEQRQRIAAVRKQIFEGEDVLKAITTTKDKDAPKEDRKAAAETMRKASEGAKAQSAAVLTEAQKALVAKLNSTYQETARSVREEYKPKLVEAKTNSAERSRVNREMRDSLANLVTTRVHEILSPEQKAAVAKAAEEIKTKSPRKRAAPDGTKKPAEEKPAKPAEDESEDDKGG